MRLKALISVAAGVVAAMLAVTPASASSNGTPGAPGAGDPYFPLAGNGGYDVRHYDLALAFAPATHTLTATATITAVATQNLSRFDLDFTGLTITDLRVNGLSARYVRHGQELVITPSRVLRTHQQFTVRVAYSGRPETIDDPALGVYGWVNTGDGAVALNEPDGARTWYPVNDDMGDKATYAFHLTTPSGITALANGEPGRPVTRGATTTVTWTMRDPMSSYLAMVAIGDFAVTRTNSRGLLNITAVDTASDADRALLHTSTADAVTRQASTFGPYPFDSTGGIIDLSNVGYALETQGRPVYENEPDELTVVHEIAHQWYGDSVTPTTWADIWLNEGFATYAEWLWTASHGGDSVQATFDALYATPAGAAFWDLKTGNPGRDHMFDYEPVYLRGAMTLQAIRMTIGDKAFFTLLKQWASKNRYGSVDTADLEKLASKIGHKDLSSLFTAWVYTAAKPSL